MAKLVCIAEGTVRPGISAVGDIVSIHDDDVGLDGSGYATFQVLSFPGLAAADAYKSLNGILPKVARAHRLMVGGKWTMDEPERMEVWLDSNDGKWKELATPPKYPWSLKDLTPLARASLEDDKVSSSVRLVTLESQTKINITTNPDNLVEVADLNKV